MNLCYYEKTLTERVLDFQRTGKGFCTLLDDLCLKIYRYPKAKYGLSDDDCGNFYLFFIPKLKKIAQTYKNAGSTFETYFNSVLFWKLKAYLNKQSVFNHTWKTSALYDFWEPEQKGNSVLKIYLQIVEDSTLADIFMINRNGKMKNEAGKKQFLLFILKKAKDLDLEDISFISNITGYDYYWLIEIVEKLKDSLSCQFQRLARFRARRNRAFWRLKFFEKQLNNETDKRQKARLKEKIERARETMKTAMDIISRIRLAPTHRKIAALFNVPKGTIDSLFLRLRKKLKRVYKQQKKQYA
ncbi:MAG: hypothetical protein JXB88_25670 [Spirochaetales bacterium]|nr:hypothetical protein [Spirochaetales bacterium]